LRCKMVRNCKRCGNLFTPYPWAVKLGKGFFCSHSCASQGRPTLTPEDFWERTDRDSGQNWNGTPCWIFTSGETIQGYKRISFRGRKVRVHRLAYELTFGAIPPGMFVLHHCDHPLCVNPEHLFLGTTADNSHDMVSKNRQASGSRHHAAKLNETKVAEIRQLYVSGQFPKCHSVSILAKMFGVHKETVRDVVQYRRWC
jgi:hypothetical protein